MSEYRVIENGNSLFLRTNNKAEAIKAARAEQNRWKGEGVTVEIRKYKDGFDPAVDSDMDYIPVGFRATAEQISRAELLFEIDSYLSLLTMPGKAETPLFELMDTTSLSDYHGENIERLCQELARFITEATPEG